MLAGMLLGWMSLGWSGENPAAPMQRAHGGWRCAGRSCTPPAVSVRMRLRRSAEPQSTERQWQSVHHDANRHVFRHNTVEWLRTGRSDAGEDLLPEGGAYNIVTGLPDISEIKPRLTPAEYEAWCEEMVARLVDGLAPEQVAIFIVTPGRYSGEGGSWLDKGYLCQLGARRARARCVWQKVVLVQDSAGRRRGGVRPGFVNFLCFSRAHRVPADFATVDVLPDRGHMSWSHAIGEAACAAAVEYIVDHVGGPLVNPFCGYGSALAVANACGIDAYGMDISLKCCRIAHGHEASDGIVEDARQRRAAARREAAERGALGQMPRDE